MKGLRPVLVVVLFLSATLWAEPPKNSASGKSKPYQVGKASWYGKQFHGRTTANGEEYDMFQFTAAHRHLPLGTWIKVTNLKSGKWVVVRVNDRGPYVGDRVLDLSYAAAQMLGMRGKGIARVRIDVIQPDVVALREDPARMTSEVSGLR